MAQTKLQSIKDANERKAKSEKERRNFITNCLVNEKTKIIWDGEILDCSIIFSTATGVYILHKEKQHVHKILSGKFYGITKFKNFWFFARSSNNGKRGWVENERVSDICIFQEKETTLSFFKLAFYGIPKELHQIDTIENDLIFPHTDYNQIVTIPIQTLFDKTIFFGSGEFESIELALKETSHLNSVFRYQKKLYVIAHNFTMKTGNSSDLIIYNLEKKSYLSEPLNAHSAHNFYKNAENTLFCDSGNKKLVKDGKVIFQGDMLLRGLSLNDQHIFVGGSDLTLDRYQRFSNTSKIYVLNLPGKLISTIVLPDFGDIYEIRQFKGKDFCFSASFVE